MFNVRFTKADYFENGKISNTSNPRHVVIITGWTSNFQKLFEPQHDKTNKVSVRPAKIQMPSLSSLRCPHEETLDP